MIPYASLREQDRINLVTQSPLPAPLTIYIEPTNLCNFRCTMCPESLPDYRERAGYHETMDLNTYEKVLFQVQEFGLIKSLKLYDEGEPLLNQDIVEMIRKGVGVAERVEVTTNASLLTPGMAWLLVASGLQYLRVSVYGMGDAHNATTGQRRWTPSMIWKNVATLRALRDKAAQKHPFIHAQLLSNDPAEAEVFKKWYGPVADGVGVEWMHNWGSTPLVNIGTPQSPKSIKRVCPAPFYSLVVKANGDVTPCCVDWQGKLKLGNVNTSTLKQMWNGDVLRDLRVGHLKGDRGWWDVCKSCTYIHTMPDNLDALTPEVFLGR